MQQFNVKLGVQKVVLTSAQIADMFSTCELIALVGGPV
jgi:hypothetical protein